MEKRRREEDIWLQNRMSRRGMHNGVTTMQLRGAEINPGNLYLCKVFGHYSLKNTHEYHNLSSQLFYVISLTLDPTRCR